MKICHVLSLSASSPGGKKSFKKLKVCGPYMRCLRKNKGKVAKCRQALKKCKKVKQGATRQCKPLSFCMAQWGVKRKKCMAERRKCMRGAVRELSP